MVLLSKHSLNHCSKTSTVPFLSSLHICRIVAFSPEDIDLDASAVAVGTVAVVIAMVFSLAAVIAAMSAAGSCPAGRFAVVHSVLAEDDVELFSVRNSLAKVSFAHCHAHTGAALEREFSIT